MIACDLTADRRLPPAQVAELGREVDLLVNNAGFGTYGRFWEIEPGRDAEMVRVNCEVVVTLTRAFLPSMVERRSGGVIVVASTAGMQPIPYEMTYAASKAFALSFTEALHEELRGTGVKAARGQPRSRADRVAGRRRIRGRRRGRPWRDHRRPGRQRSTGRLRQGPALDCPRHPLSLVPARQQHRAARGAVAGHRAAI